jgi:hypothetical protein
MASTPANCIATRYVHSSINKIRCPIYVCRVCDVVWSAFWPVACFSYWGQVEPHEVPHATTSCRAWLTAAKSTLSLDAQFYSHSAAPLTQPVALVHNAIATSLTQPQP